MSRFAIPEEIAIQAEAEGLPRPELQRLVDHSTRATHARGNRRCGEWVFLVQGGVVLNYTKDDAHGFRCQACRDSGKIVVFDEHEPCHGQGCEECDNGLRRSFVACPACDRQ